LLTSGHFYFFTFINIHVYNLSYKLLLMRTVYGSCIFIRENPIATCGHSRWFGSYLKIFENAWKCLVGYGSVSKNTVYRVSVYGYHKMQRIRMHIPIVCQIKFVWQKIGQKSNDNSNQENMKRKTPLLGGWTLLCNFYLGCEKKCLKKIKS